MRTNLEQRPDLPRRSFILIIIRRLEHTVGRALVGEEAISCGVSDGTVLFVAVEPA